MNAAGAKKNAAPNPDQELCTTDKCNGKIFPESRLHCLHCAGGSCVNQSDTIEVRHPCVNYVREDRCYSIFEFSKCDPAKFALAERIILRIDGNVLEITILDGNNAYRGCFSDSNDSFGKQYCVNHADHCTKCPTRGCNSDPVDFEKPTLSCVKCVPSETNKCETVADDVQPELCEPTVAGYVNKCYMYVGDNEQVHRGCFYEASEHIRYLCGDAELSDSCTTCNESNCNRHPFQPGKIRLRPRRKRALASRKCLRCSSADDVQCRYNPQLFERAECAGDRCATYIAANRTIIRDCASNLEDVANYTDDTPSTTGVAAKSTENGQLITCDADNCNNIASAARYCFECDSRIDPACAASVSSPMIALCPYDSNDYGCFHHQSGAYIDGLVFDLIFHFVSVVNHPTKENLRCFVYIAYL